MNNAVFKIFCGLLCLYLFPLFSEDESSIEIRSAAFFPSSNLFREIYGNVGASYQIEASTKLNYCLDGWTNFDWFSKHGKSEGFENSTRVNIANISLGIKFPWQFSECFAAYVGIGPSLSRIWLNNRSQCKCTHRKVSKLAVGGLLKTGINYFITQQMFIDVFVDYLYQPTNFETQIDIGGIKMGLGVGVKF